MKEKVYFYASVQEDLTIIPEGSQVYDKLTKCILQKSCELMSDKGIKPTSGVLTTAESGYKEYTIIERYDNHFLNLNCSIFIYYIPQNYNKIINNKTIEETKVLKKQKIDNLYEYLETKKNIKLIKNNNLDKWWYNIPTNNDDIIQKIFLSVVDEENKIEKKKKINSLKKLFPNQLMIIKKLEKIMFRMDKDEFIKFINTIYLKRHKMLDIDEIIKKEEDCSIKLKVKRLLNVNK